MTSNVTGVKKDNSVLYFIFQETSVTVIRAQKQYNLHHPYNSYKIEYSATVLGTHISKKTMESVHRRASKMVFNKSWRERDVSPTEIFEHLDAGPCPPKG